MSVCLSLHMCLYMVKGVHSLSRRRSYVVQSNVYSWEVLCKSSRSSSDVVQVKFVLMGRFVVCVGRIFAEVRVETLFLL